MLHSKIQFIIFLFLCVCKSVAGFAQQDSIGLKGYLFDDFTHTGIKDVKVYLMSRDSVIHDSTITQIGQFWQGGTKNIDARYMFNVEKQKNLKKILLKFVHPEYKTEYKEQSLRFLGKQKEVLIPTVYLKRRNTFLDRNLDDVVVTATKVQFYYKGDTLVYDASAFKIADGSMLDELIKQLPGVEINENCEIFVKGKKVNSLLLNGKDFFSGKRQLLLENLPYYTVKDIKVYDKSTPKAIALNDNDAPKEFVMDVCLKREYRKGYLLNAEMGEGTEDSYLDRLFGTYFTDKSHIAIVVGANNMNSGNYQYRYGGYDASLRDGRSDSKSLNTEYQFKDHRKKNTISLDVNRLENTGGSNEYQETFHGKDKNTYGVNKSDYCNENIDMSLKNDFCSYKPFWFQSTNQLNFRKNNSENNFYEYESETDTRKNGAAVLDSLFHMGIAVNDGFMQSARSRLLNGKNKSFGFKQDLSLAFNVFNVDVIDINSNFDYKRTKSNISRNNRYMTYNIPNIVTNVDESIDNPDRHLGAFVGFAYQNKRFFTRRNSYVSLFANYQYNNDRKSESIYDAVSLSKDNGNSYIKKQAEHKYVAGIQLLYEGAYKEISNSSYVHTSINLSIPYTIRRRNTNYMRSVLDTCVTQNSSYLEPVLSIFRLKDSRGPMAIVDGSRAYSSIWGYGITISWKHDVVDAIQLISLPQTSDRLNIFSGNPNLKNSSVWNSNFSWKIPLQDNNGYMRQELNYSLYFDRIINAYNYNHGVYSICPMNVNGTWKLYTKIESELGLKIKGHSYNFKWGISGSFDKMKNNILNDACEQSEIVDNNEMHLSLPLKISSHFLNRKLYLSVRTGCDWKTVFNNKLNQGYNDALEFNCCLGSYVNLPAGIGLDTDFNILKRYGYSNEELNRLSLNWDVSLIKSIINNKIKLKLTAIDIFHHYKALAYYSNERGIREVHSVSLPAYVLFTASYSFNKEPGR